MGMSMTNRRLVGLLALAAAVAAGGGYAWARTLHMPQIVDIGSTACGVPETSPRFGVPLAAMMRVAGGLPFGVGPLEVPEGGGPVSLRFEPALDGEADEVRLAGAMLHLPTSFGHDRQLPRRITLHCRDGAIGSVRYQAAGGASTVFNVVRNDAGACDRAAAPPPDPS
jgi:hypothetical protein